ncbi:ribose-5-phosphate isomerase RpiA [Sphingomonas quercus]|uniref:Ribose-5-phosphate isomerase A n=1 Tax=Sphingomonas quercus TaxID=2842451 RepID=A0ABS6BIE9_9SPHN|nr:ribose-5-phosphate isomerase RpiA [Sphingomonas quercus]MBU3078090.1 ribose-5-phosphate isomerase RpiA [Sphingomonas quercus]
MAPSPSDALKRAAAEAAVDEVKSGMIVGLGTGSTAAFAIEALARKARNGLDIRAVATSERSAAQARAEGITLIDMDGLAAIDLAIDGVDEIDARLRAIKGAGGAMLREKIVAAAARRMIAVADVSKAVDRLGQRPVPVEVLPLAQGYVAAAIRALGGDPALRAGTRTDQGNVILDCRFAALDDPAALADRLAAIPGALGHGLFVTEIDALYLATPGGIVVRARPG